MNSSRQLENLIRRVLSGIVWLNLAIAVAYALPTIGPASITPSTIPLGTPFTLTVTCVITDASVITSSVNVLRTDPQGNVTIVGQLHDDGTNGDLVAGDRTFTGQIRLTENQAESLAFQVSAAVPGTLDRIKSNAVSVNVRLLLPEEIASLTLQQLLSPLGIAVDSHAFSQSGAVAQAVRLSWASPANLAVIYQQHNSGAVPLRRAVNLVSTDFLVVGLDEQDKLQAWVVVGDPRTVRSEVPDSSGVLTGQQLSAPHADFTIAIPDSPAIKEVRIYQPNWNGQGFTLTLVGTASLS
jgi:hypothetical protein